MFLKNNLLIPNILMGIGLALSLGACDDDNDAADSSAFIDRPVKTTLTLHKYYDGNGSSNQLKWTDTDMAVLHLASNGASATAAPIRPGQTSSLFLFTLNSPARATVVSYYPTDADITVGNGAVSLEIPTEQDGTISPMLIGHDNKVLSSYEGCDIDLKHFPAIMMVNIARGNYSVESVEIHANSGENLGGKISVEADTWTVSASDPTVRVNLPTPIDCSLESKTVAMQLAPVSLSGGYTVTVKATDGHTLTVTSDNPLNLKSGELYTTTDAADSEPPHLIIGGSNRVHIVNVAKCMNGDYKAGLEWTWEAEKAAPILGIAANRCNHIDDCKPVDNGTKLLITSSYNWCLLLDRATQEVLFHAVQCSNAHSAELLPDNRVAVACSDGSSSDNNQIRLYDLSRSNQLLHSVPLRSAHGVTWCESTRRLYAVGTNQLMIFSLQDWDTNSPKLKLERTVTTPQGSCHDLTLADANTLVVSGVRSYLFDVNSESFTEMPHFAASRQLKSVNYNPLTSELWYTDATVPEGTQSWSTHTLRYATDIAASSMAGSISITDMDVYKVRVLNW